VTLTLLILFCGGCGGGSNSGTEGEEAGEALTSADPGVALAATPGEENALPEWVGSDPLELSEEEISRIQLQSARVVERSLSARLPVMGRVLAHQHRRAIVSYPFSARISRIVAQVGDWVEPGDSLVVLQSEEVGEATAALYSASADLELAQVNHERETQLFENGVGARKNLTTAEAQMRVASATLDAAEKKLHVLGFTEAEIERLQETHQINPTITLFAPIAGKVVTNTAVLGGMVDESTEILTLMDPTVLWVEAEIYERDIARVHTGQEVEVSVPAYPDEVFRGTLSYISDILDPETRTITVRTEVANRNLLLKPGMFADLTIVLNHNGAAAAVPRGAILDDQGLPFLFVREGPRSFSPRLVTLGSSDEEWVEIRDGVSLDDEVVTQGNFQLKSKLYEAALEAGHHH
jgi:cobalt-zinc-cadmium efflux system membrane fusion protein